MPVDPGNNEASQIQFTFETERPGNGFEVGPSAYGVNTGNVSV